MSRILSAMGLCLALFVQAASPAPPAVDDAVRNDRLNRLRGEAPHVEIRIDDGAVRQLYNAVLSKGSTAERSARSFLDRHLDLFDVAPDMLRFRSSDKVMGEAFTVLSYSQEIQGIPVYDSWLKLLVRNEVDHPLVLVNSSLQAVTSIGTPDITAVHAIAAARQAEPTLVRHEVPDLVYYPADDGLHLCWRFFADNGAERGFDRVQFFVDAVTARIVARLPGVLFETLNGTVTGLRSPPPLPDAVNNPPQLGPMYGARVRIDEGQPVFVDALGQFMLPNVPSNATTVQVDVQSRWGAVHNSAGPDLSATMPIMPPGPVTFMLNEPATEFITAQLNAMIEITRVHNFIQSVNPTVTQINSAIPTYVNVGDNCNAQYQVGIPTLRFFASGDGCPNTAYAGVVHHEYGHFFIDSAPGGPESDRYHEGMADTIAIMLSNDPCVAPDLFGVDTGCLRNPATTELSYPCIGAAHFCSQVLSGAFWDMRTNLISDLGEDDGLALARRLAVGQVMIGIHDLVPGVTIDVLILDDNDSDLTNGTPHFHAINEAFTAHGMPGPELTFNDGDYNGDGDVDLFDYTDFAECTTGPIGQIDESCQPGDIDGDGDVDVRDFRRFSRRFTGDCGAIVTSHPTDVAACVGDIVSFQISGVGNDLRYAWTRNNFVIEGAEGPVLVINPVTLANFGEYRGFAVGECHSAGSHPAVLTKPAPPVIHTLPQDVYTCLGETAQFSVSATGFGELTYQWYRDGEPIAGATEATFVIQPVTESDVAEYTCVVSDRCGESDSTEAAPALLDFIPPEITMHPRLTEVCLGDHVELSVVVNGREPITYQWQFEGLDIPGATQATYVIDSVAQEQIGQYRCVVGDACGGSAESFLTSVYLGVVEILASPVGGEFCTGDVLFLVIGATNGHTFQWYRDGEPIPDATLPYYFIVGVTPEDSGSYHIAAESLCNDAVSEPAVVTVNDCPSTP